MKSEWTSCKNILCIRPDNMGDLIMSAPAIRALKETFGCSITILTSLMAAGIVPFLPEIDDVILFNAPWVKANDSAGKEQFNDLVEEIKKRSFDAVVIFTVFSQNPLPSAMIAYLAGIPRRLAYCRENPYSLLTHWLPDEEPYQIIRHQVERDLQLVKFVGAVTQDKRLHLSTSTNLWPQIVEKTKTLGIDWQKPWLLLHAGVSEKKREYPKEMWIETGRLISEQLNYQVILTGNEHEQSAVEHLKNGIGKNAYNTAGLLSLEEFITVIKWAPVVVSVNTSTIHIAAATTTPVIVLYALSNPQHAPWMARGKVMPYTILKELRSRNAVLNYVDEHLHQQEMPLPTPDEIVQAIRDLLFSDADNFIPALIPLRKTMEQVL